MIGTTLISEGHQGYVDIKLAVNGGKFDWEGYFAEKSLSTAIALVQLGGSAIWDKVAGNTTAVAGVATTK